MRWKDILRDRIVVDERVYDDEFDEVKTRAGDREVPFDRYGVILVAIQRMWASNKKFRKPDDLVFANRLGKPPDRHNLLSTGTSNRWLTDWACQRRLTSGVSGSCTPVSCGAMVPGLRWRATT
jgi:hypothetical protein